MKRFIAENLEILIGVGLALFAAWRVAKHRSRDRVAKRLLRKVAEMGAEPLSLHPDIDPVKCAGCAACTAVCPEGDILQLVDHKAVLVGPTKCVGHGECERACPMGAITLVFGTKTRGVDIPRLTTHYETNVPGLYIAGELGGMGLIRNAVRQGVTSATHALSTPVEGAADYDLLIVGAGPAGIAASLVAIAQKRKYLVLEQNSFGGTVYNYPRQKIVMSHPAELPIVGMMKFAKNKVSKEELLSFWVGLKKRLDIQIREKTKFEGLEKNGSHFRVATSHGIVTAHRVVLAMGLRGSPRKLGLENEDLPKVTYSLRDPLQYRGVNVCVVGGGNAGVEAAVALGEERLGNKVTLLVRGAELDRCNEDNQRRVEKVRDAGLVQMWFHSSVTKIEPQTLKVKRENTEVTVENDFLFIFAGAEMPQKFLMGLGIVIDKKFGEAFRKTN
ncbi:MAG: NAD(P)-binding domain-containing protein [Deltaproteobacteria bacterium]|nr:NAD(P)-binding domain-containing protein [Deltaproteobacteria bacterium]MBI3294663.1 NAD(P)-binding domain-containing protein [Deltaproteobacteria bacterium]